MGAQLYGTHANVHERAVTFKWILRAIARDPGITARELREQRELPAEAGMHIATALYRLTRLGYLRREGYRTVFRYYLK